MPQAISFDTHESVKRLINAGFTEKQAEEQTHLLSDTLRDVIESSLATKSDIKEVERKIKEVEKEIKEVELRLQKEIKETELKLELKIVQAKTEILKWVAGFLLAQTGVIAALVKLL
jgi:RNA-splicing ligase RtcB